MIEFIEVTGTWDDKPLYIVGGGPSLKGFDFDRIKGKGRILGVNDAAFNCPADILFSLDQTWHQKRRQQIEEFNGEAYFAAPPSWSNEIQAIPNVKYLAKRRSTGLDLDKRDINGANSGYGAVNLAYHKRAKQIYLLGFDMKDTNDTHWYPRYEWHAKECHARFSKIADSFQNTVIPFRKYGAKIINACPSSLITAYEKCDLSYL